MPQEILEAASSSENEEFERFLPDRGSSSIPEPIEQAVAQAVATKAARAAGARRNKRNLCIILTIGIASLLGLAWWITERGRKPSLPEITAIQGAEDAATEGEEVSIIVAENPSVDPEPGDTAELIPSTVRPEETLQEKSTNTVDNSDVDSQSEKGTQPNSTKAEVIPSIARPEETLQEETNDTTYNRAEGSQAGEGIQPNSTKEELSMARPEHKRTSAPSNGHGEAKQRIKTKTKTNNYNSSRPAFGSEDYLHQIDRLVRTAMTAILEEYGQVPKGYLDDKSSTTVPLMFSWDRLDLSNATEAPLSFQKRGDLGNAGWTSDRSWNGLVLRLLQAMSQQSNFTVVLGGHSAAAGHGNHFKQSYLMQFHKVMAPVFRQMGVTLISRNQAQGGLGTIQSSLGFNSIYGSQIDLMLWDSGMTEKQEKAHIDLFFRQALMGEGRVPVVWGAGQQFDLLQMLHNEADADVGEYGIGWDGIPETTDEQQVEGLPWAVQHLKCSQERKDLCKHPYKFCATCWIERQDGIHPAQTQYEYVHGQVRWHPGWRRHQLIGRVLAFSLLQALQDALAMIRSTSNPQARDAFDLTNYYHNIRSKVKRLDQSLGDCYSIKGLPERICQVSMKGRTQYTPRDNPEETSVTSILKPAPNGYVPRNNLKPLYTGPDAHNSCFDLPQGAVDVVAKIEGLENGTKRHLSTGGFVTEADRVEHLSGGGFVTEADRAERNSKKEADADEETGTASSINSDAFATVEATAIVPGLGWQVFDEPQGICDGTYDSICAKSTRNRCVLYGHHDQRGAVLGSEVSGWLVLQIPRDQVQEGIIILKLHTWYESGDNGRTNGWQTVNNVPRENGTTGGKTATANASGGLQSLGHTDASQEDYTAVGNTSAGNVTEGKATASNTTGGDQTLLNDDDPRNRHLRQRGKYETPPLDEQFQFEYAIDGLITTLDRKQFFRQKKDIGKVVEVLTLLDDEAYTETHQAQASSLVEVAIRMRGCMRRCVFGVSHIYWA